MPNMYACMHGNQSMYMVESQHVVAIGLAKEVCAPPCRISVQPRHNAIVLLRCLEAGVLLYKVCLSP